MKRREDPNQTLINWTDPTAVAIAPASSIPDPIKLAAQAPAPLVQRLPWDFTTSFPQPTDEAIDAGVIDEADCEPENLKSLHQNYTQQCLATLAALDKMLDARRRGIDPGTGKPPRTHAAKERLRKYLSEEPGRLEHTFQILIETYENAFGPDAAQAFAKFIRARHAGIPVEVDATDRQHEKCRQAVLRPAIRRKSPAVLPIPKPLPEAIADGHFGKEESGKPVNPTPAEVRAITENQAELIIGLVQGLRQIEHVLASPQCSDRARLERERALATQQVNAAVDKYAKSFGKEPAERLEAYARRQVLLGDEPGHIR